MSYMMKLNYFPIFVLVYIKRKYNFEMKITTYSYAYNYEHTLFLILKNKYWSLLKFNKVVEIIFEAL